MIERPSPRLICVGPTGIGYCCEVDELPPADGGCFARRTSTRLIWDSAAVAYLLRDEFSTLLITNHLGRGTEAERVRSFLRDRVRVIELGAPSDRCPFDVIILARSTGTRQWISARYGPPSSLVSHELMALLNDRADCPHTFLYIEAAFDDLRNWLFATAPFASLPELAYTLINFGDTSSIGGSDICAALAVAPPRAIIQWSVPEPVGSSLLSELRTASLIATLAAKRSALLFTMGAAGGLMASEDGVERIGVPAVESAVSVSAGGVVSASVLRELSRSHERTSTIVFDALNAATAYVAAQSGSITMVNDLELR